MAKYSFYMFDSNGKDILKDNENLMVDYFKSI